MKDIIFKGCGTAICTPFDEAGKINYNEFGKFIEFQIENQVDAIIVCGTTGESATMSEYEKKECIKFVVEKVNKRIPVIAGTGTNNTKNTIDMTKYAEKVGADGALIVTPYYNKTTQEGLIKHYSKIAQSTNLPIILYNVPSRTGINIEPKTYYELSKIDNIVATKEASGNISQIAQIVQLCGNNLYIYSGNDDQIVPILSLGGIGVISVLSNIAPKFTHSMIEEYTKGNGKVALEKQISSLELINCLFLEVNPIPVKEAINAIGFGFGKPRLPLVSMSEGKKKYLYEAISDFGLEIANQ